MEEGHKLDLDGVKYMHGIKRHCGNRKQHLLLALRGLTPVKALLMVSWP